MAAASKLMPRGGSENVHGVRRTAQGKGRELHFGEVGEEWRTVVIMKTPISVLIFVPDTGGRVRGRLQVPVVLIVV
eukprot:760824-Hanusia_phi.AAC.3